MSGRDWLEWHRGYDDPASSLSARPAVVRRRVGEALDDLLPCGIFGNLADDDVQSTLAAVPAMVAPGGLAAGALPDRLFTFVR